MLPDSILIIFFLKTPRSELISQTHVHDKMLESVEAHILELLPLVHSIYSTPSTLLWEGDQILSSEGVQQDDPLGPMLFCLRIHELLFSIGSEFRVFFTWEVTLQT